MRAETIPAPASPGAGSVLYLFHSRCVSRIAVPFFLPSPERKNRGRAAGSKENNDLLPPGASTADSHPPD